MSKLIDITGKRFELLVVIKRLGSDTKGKATWLCRCDCGEQLICVGANLRSGNTNSCGCLRLEHGHTTDRHQSKTYGAWAGMIKRCINPNNAEYHNYGGRGIKVCNRWQKFTNFLEDMGEAPEEHQIDRIDNNKGYHKENCRWATPKQNSRNKRNNRFITHNGKTQCLSAWSEEVGIHRATIVARILRGWSIAEALTEPMRNKTNG